MKSGKGRYAEVAGMKEATTQRKQRAGRKDDVAILRTRAAKHVE